MTRCTHCGSRILLEHDEPDPTLCSECYTLAVYDAACEHCGTVPGDRPCLDMVA